LLACETAPELLLAERYVYRREVRLLRAMLERTPDENPNFSRN
jgi:hypothetical protein